jgi:hypothetical protein
MACFLVLAVAPSASWLGEALEWTETGPAQSDPFSIFGPAAVDGSGLRGWCRLFGMIRWATSSTAGSVRSCGDLLLVVIVLIKAVFSRWRGCVVLTKRRLAQVVV